MASLVIKRDGCRAPFEQARILEAIKGAASAAAIHDDDYCAQVTEHICRQLTQEEVDIHVIQNTVENALMAGPYPALARTYIEYRHDRDIARELRGKLNKAIRGLVEQSNPALLNENANKDSKVIPTQRDLLAGIVAKH